MLRSTSHLRPKFLVQPTGTTFQFTVRQYAQTEQKADGKKSKDKGRVICVTSGKGGVGKTTTAASISFGLAEKGFKTCAVDFDIGLRNLDIHFGMERRVIFDFIHVIQQECTLNQALIKDKRNPLLHLLAASQTKDKNALNEDRIDVIMEEMREKFDYIVCDSPAGIENGAKQALYWADDAIVCTNPEVSSVRDSDKMIGFISSSTKRAALGQVPVKPRLLVTRYNPQRVAEGGMLSLTDIMEMLGIPLLGVVPESTEIMEATNLGQPVVVKPGKASTAYQDAVARYLGEEIELKFTEIETEGFFGALLKKFRK